MSRLFIGTFAIEEDVLGAVRATREAGLSIRDVLTPYSVHGLDEAMGLGSSRLTWVCFLCGMTGLLFALWLQVWTSSIDWPINVGGKPFNSIPAFVPVAFELTVLIGGLGTVSALLLRSRLLPGRRPALHVPGATDDRFALAVDMADDRFDERAMRALCRRFNATEAYVMEEE